MLRIELVAHGSDTGFQTRLEGLSRPASTINRPVYGLTPTQISGGTLSGGLDGSYVWHTQFRAEAGGYWIETTLTARQTIEFDPSMLFWIGELDHLNDRQAHTWRQTVLRGPTTNQQGLGGNDLPACYLYDHESGVETICFYPPESFAWAAQRFYEFTAREVLQYRPAARYGLGLTANSPQSPFVFEPGTYQFRYWFTQALRSTIPTAWEAQKSLIDAIAPLLDVIPRPSQHPVNWADIAQNTVDDLHDEACWTTVGGVTGLRAYVRGSSAVNRDHARGFELMTQLDVLWPMLMWRAATSSIKADSVIERLLATLPHFDRPDQHFVANGYPARLGDTFMDTWYFLENALIKLGWVAYLTGEASLKSMFKSALGGAKTLFDNTSGLFPLFADASDWAPRQSVLNAGVGGLYAAGCVIAAQLMNDRTYLDQAAAALKILHNLPPQMLTHEPQQLTFSAAAARYLAANGYGESWRQVAADFVRLSLRMGYWGSDPAVPFYDPRGMFQACASLGYPAYKENIETLLAWPELLSDHNATLPVNLMAAFANLQRAHNTAFFDPWLPAEFRRGPCPHVPYEDLATSEFPHTATLGKELYGTGEVFWSALLFDLAGHTDAVDILVLALDIPCLELRPVPQKNRRLLLYNPQPVPRQVRLSTDNTNLAIELAARASSIVEEL